MVLGYVVRVPVIAPPHTYAAWHAVRTLIAIGRSPGERLEGTRERVGGGVKEGRAQALRISNRCYTFAQTTGGHLDTCTAPRAEPGGIAPLCGSARR